MMTEALTRRNVLKAPAALAVLATPYAASAQPPQHGFFLISNPPVDSITFNKGETVETIEVAPSPWGVAVGPDGQAYVSFAQGLAVVDGQKLLVSEIVPYQMSIEPVGYGEYRSGGMGVAVTPDGETVAVGIHLEGFNGLVELYDVASGEFVATAPVGVRPFDVVASPDNAFVYSIDHDSFTITAIELSTRQVTTIEAAPLGYGEFDKPHYAAVRSDGALLLPYSGKALWILDPATGTSSSLPLTANTHQHGITLSADESTAYIVGTGPAGSATGPPSLTILHLETGEERIIELELPHEQVALTEDGTTAVLTGGFTFADGGWDGITYVDLESGATTTLQVGGRPLAIARLN